MAEFLSLDEIDALLDIAEDVEYEKTSFNPWHDFKLQIVNNIGKYTNSSITSDTATKNIKKLPFDKYEVTDVTFSCNDEKLQATFYIQNSLYKSIKDFKNDDFVFDLSKNFCETVNSKQTQYLLDYKINSKKVVDINEEYELNILFNFPIILDDEKIDIFVVLNQEMNDFLEKYIEIEK